MIATEKFKNCSLDTYPWYTSGLNKEKTKPTMEEVREHFKNAKEVKSSWSGVVFEYKEKVLEHTVSYSDGFFLLWNVHNGYSEIVSYKEPLKQTVKQLLKGSEFENLDWIFYTKDYGESRRGLVVDGRKIKLTQEQAEDII
jgi:hypothetical protein